MQLGTDIVSTMPMKRPINRALISIQRRRCYRIAAASTQPRPLISSLRRPPLSLQVLTPPASPPERAAAHEVRQGTRWHQTASVSARREPHPVLTGHRNAGVSLLTSAVGADRDSCGIRMPRNTINPLLAPLRDDPRASAVLANPDRRRGHGVLVILRLVADTTGRRRSPSFVLTRRGRRAVVGGWVLPLGGPRG